MKTQTICKELFHGKRAARNMERMIFDLHLSARRARKIRARFTGPFDQARRQTADEILADIHADIAKAQGCLGQVHAELAEAMFRCDTRDIQQLAALLGVNHRTLERDFDPDEQGLFKMASLHAEIMSEPCDFVPEARREHILFDAAVHAMMETFDRSPVYRRRVRETLREFLPGIGLEAIPLTERPYLTVVDGRP